MQPDNTSQESNRILPSQNQDIPQSKPGLAYFVNIYPKVSHSFIRREIMALERRGFSVSRFALRGWDDGLVDGDDMAEQAATYYVLRHGMSALLRAAWRMLLRLPGPFFKAMKLACKMGMRADRPLPLHLVYLAEACILAPLLTTRKIRHIHAHFGTNSTEVVMLASVLTGIPYSFTVHGPEEFDKPQFIGLGEKIRRASFVVAITSFCRSQLYRWAEARDWKKIQIVHCGLEDSFHQPQEAQGAEPFAPPVTESHQLVCIGRLCEQKGQLLLLHAMALVRDAGLHFRLVLAGDGEMRADIEREIEHLHLREQVHITGWISSARVRQELLAARAMILPSFAEGLPVVIMEAMALGKPVITTYIAGIPELVLGGQSGWLVPAGDVKRLAAAIIDCLSESPESLEKMGQAGRARALAEHNVDQEAARLDQMFCASAQGLAQPVFHDR